MYTARLRECDHATKFIRYIVYKKCHKIYYISDCIEGSGMAKKSKCCSFQKFPFHQQRRMRAECGTLLLKTVELAGGRKEFYPYMTYCYLNLDISLQLLLNKPEFFEQCELWRNRKKTPGVLRDVYDGKLFSNITAHHFYLHLVTTL